MSRSSLASSKNGFKKRIIHVFALKWTSTDRITTQVFIMPLFFDGTRLWRMHAIQLGLGRGDRDGMTKAFMRNAQS
jgi:hypothetical protein